MHREKKFYLHGDINTDGVGRVCFPRRAQDNDVGALTRNGSVMTFFFHIQNIMHFFKFFKFNLLNDIFLGLQPNINRGKNVNL